MKSVRIWISTTFVRHAASRSNRIYTLCGRNALDFCSEKVVGTAADVTCRICARAIAAGAVPYEEEGDEEAGTETPNPLRIAVSGAQGVGKSTLAEALAERLRLPLISEVARSVALEMDIRRDMPLPPGTAMGFQRKVFLEQLYEENKRWKCGFVADRSIVDQASYLLLKAAAHHFEKGDLYTVYHVMRATIERAQQYSLVVVVPPRDGSSEYGSFGSIKDDGFRATDWFYQQIVHKLISAHVQAWCPHHHVVPADATLEERVESVLGRLREMGWLGGKDGAS